MEEKILKQKYHKITIFLLLCFAMGSAGAQENRSFGFYDSLTWKMYQEKNWNDLLKISKTALGDGHDYFYLRMRRGSAFFEKQNYRKALTQFRKALEYDNIDPLATKYYYFSLLNSGRSLDALLFYYNHRHVLEGETDNPKRAFKNLTLEISLCQNEPLNKGHGSEIEFGQNSQGSQIRSRNYFSGSFYLEHDLTKRISFYHGGSFLRKDNWLMIKTQNEILEYDHYQINQFQYYAGSGFNAGRGFHFNAIMHIVNHNPVEGTVRPHTSGNATSFSNTGKTDFLYRFSIYKDLGLFNLGTGYSHSGFNDAKQKQVDFTLLYYPLGNLNLYFMGGIYAVYEKISGPYSESRFTGRFLAGVKLSEHLWLENNHYLGKIFNMALNEGYIVYNNREEINYLGTISFIFPFNKLRYTLRGTWMNTTSDFINTEYLETGLNSLHYNGFNLTGGLTWNF